MSWNTLELGSSLEALIDNRGKNPPYADDGIPTVSGMTVGAGVLNLASARCVSYETWQQWMPEPTKRNDVVLTSEAPLGRAALVPTDSPLVLAQRVFGLRGKPGILDSRFLYYAFQTVAVQADLQGRATGTTVLGIRQPALKKVQIPAPNYAEQQAIAEVLGALDDKIAANTELAATADEFLAAQLSVLLDSAFEEVRLGDIAEVNAETVKPTSGGYLRYIDIASVGIGAHDYPELMPWEDAPSRARRRVHQGDTIWSTVRPNRRSHSLNLSEDSLIVGSTGLAVISPRRVGFAYLYEVTKRPEFTAYLENVAEGSAYPAVRSDRFADASVPYLPKPRLEEFEALAAPIRQQMYSLTVENRTLASTRDALLPQLMSGKLQIKDAEILISTAL
ncbi:hypothetical protein B5P43_24395 [Bacillus sp. SRB_336]|nr:hypothetical protein B5P43_24395 [Bacillus sp. SRB_336]